VLTLCGTKVSHRSRRWQDKGPAREGKPLIQGYQQECTVGGKPGGNVATPPGICTLNCCADMGTVEPMWTTRMTSSTGGGTGEGYWGGPSHQIRKSHLFLPAGVRQTMGRSSQSEIGGYSSRLGGKHSRNRGQG